MDFGKLNRAFVSSKLGKKEVAVRMNCSRTTLDNLLQGGDAKISTLESFAKAIGVDIRMFFDPADASSPEPPVSSSPPLNEELIRLRSENSLLRDLLDDAMEKLRSGMAVDEKGAVGGQVA